MLADEVLYVRSYAIEQARREAIGLWVNHFNYHRPHTACGDQPPASHVPACAKNVMPSYNYSHAGTLAAQRSAALGTARTTHPERFSTTDDPKILALPTDAWINRPPAAEPATA